MSIINPVRDSHEVFKSSQELKLSNPVKGRENSPYTNSLQNKRHASASNGTNNPYRKRRGIISNGINLSPDEKIKITLRKHWFILLKDIFGLIVLYIAPFIVYFYFFDNAIITEFFNNKIHARPTLPIIIFAISIWTLIAWIKLFTIWTDYYLDVWFITNKRIIDIEQKGFFRREISTFRMERIQDITIEIKGMLQTFLDFGDIHVQTAGESQEFIIRGIRHPKQIKEIIMYQSDIALEDKNQISAVN